MKTANQILESKNVPFEKIEDIVNNLDIAIREQYNVSQPIHLWDKYYLGDAKKADLLSASGYTDIDSLLNDMTADLAEAAENVEYAPDFTLKEYGNSVYVLSNDEFDINDAIMFLTDNREDHEKFELKEENEPAVAAVNRFKYCVVFHRKN
jgi:hypothetical protein